MAESNNPTKSNKAWWTFPDEDTRRNMMYAALTEMETRQRYRRNANIYNMRLYGGTDSAGLGANISSTRSGWGMSKGRLTFNGVQSVIDTATAKIAKNKPRPKFLTSGGNWAQKMKAQKLTKFLDGEFYRLNIPALMLMVFRHAAILGDGFLHIFRENGKPAAEWVFPDEIKVDEDEAIYGQPRTMYRVKIVDKAVLIAKFPEHEDKIIQAPLPKEADWLYYRNPNLTTVVEAWHLPSKSEDQEEIEAEEDGEMESEESENATEETGEQETDGLHTLSIVGTTLLDEPYNRDEFPLIKFSIYEAVLGYWGIGWASMLAALQVQLQKTLGRFQDCMHLASVTRIWVPIGSGVNVSAMGNMPAAKYEYTGNQPPTIDNRDAVPREIMEHALWLIQAMFQQAGVSQMSAAAVKPEGLDSGKAIREFGDATEERFMIQGQSWEAAHLAVGRHLIYQAHQCALENGGKYATRFPDKKSFQKIELSDTDLAGDDYIMQLFPTSSLSQTPAGRLADVNDLLTLGIITDKAQAQELLQFPDLESSNNLELAAFRDIERTIQMILEDGKYDPPDPLQNLVLGVKMMTLAYLEARDAKAPQDHLNKALQWIDTAKNLLMPPAPPMGAGPAGGPPAPPPSPGGPGAPLPPPMGPTAPPMPGPAGPPPGTPLA